MCTVQFITSVLSLSYGQSWRTRVSCKKHYGPSLEWESKPSSGTSNGEVLFPYFQNKTRNKFSNSVARTPGVIWSLLFKCWYLWIFRFFHVSVVLPENLEYPTCPDGLLGPSVITLKNLTALHEKQHGIVYQVGTMEYQAPYVWRIIFCLKVFSHLLNFPSGSLFLLEEGVEWEL